VDALAGQGVERDRHRRGERLAFAGDQLGECPGVHDGAGGDLHVEWPQAEGALRRHADQAEHLGQELVERLAAAGPAAQPGRLLLDLGVGDRLELGLALADGRHQERGPGQAALPGQADGRLDAVGGRRAEAVGHVLGQGLGGGVRGVGDGAHGAALLRRGTISILST
jgi:hypothetical protein